MLRKWVPCEIKLHKLLKMTMRITATRKILTASRDYDDLVIMLSTDPLLTSPTIIIATNRQEIKDIPRLPMDVNHEEDKKHSRRDVITAITTSPSSKHLFILNLSIFITLKKGTSVRNIEKFLLMNETCSLVKLYHCVHRVLVIHSPFQNLISSSVLLSFLPPLLSSFIHFKLRRNIVNIGLFW